MSICVAFFSIPTEAGGQETDWLHMFMSFSQKVDVSFVSIFRGGGYTVYTYISQPGFCSSSSASCDAVIPLTQYPAAIFPAAGTPPNQETNIVENRPFSQTVTTKSKLTNKES